MQKVGRKVGKKGLKTKAWTAFARWVKVQAADKYGMCACVTCGRRLRWDDRGLHAGHFVGGRGGAVLFNESVVRPQCAICNIWKGGEQGKYTLYLIDKEGLTLAQVNELLALRSQVHKHSEDDYKRIAEEYNNKADAIMAAKGL